MCNRRNKPATDFHLSEMSDISSLSTPTPEPGICEGSVTRHGFSPVEGHHLFGRKLPSTPPPILNELTPPPSTQLPLSVAKSNHSEPDNPSSNFVGSASPARNWGNLIFSTGLFGEIPTVEAIQEYTDEQLRGLVAELLPALSEARMSAAHAKLQYNLLSIENAESMKRAEVEHEMTRREVEVLQESATMPPGGSKSLSSPRTPHPGTQRHLDLALKHCREMQTDKAFLERRLRRARKLILRLDGKNIELTEEIQLLRLRIKQNRDRFNAMRSSGAISITSTPFSDFGTPLSRENAKKTYTARTGHDLTAHVGSQDAFDALLFAGQVLNEETNSVPSTPSLPKPRKPHSSHVRGAHSLSSLPVTPDRSRQMTADGTRIEPVSHHMGEGRRDFSAKPTPMAVLEDDRLRERDSTISASDNEDEAYTDVDIPASQASQRATNLLRLLPDGRPAGAAAFKNPPSSKRLSQSKLTGQLKKDGMEKSEHRKRGRDLKTSEVAKGNKKLKMADGNAERIGLGIANWSSPRH